MTPEEAKACFTVLKAEIDRVKNQEDAHKSFEALAQRTQQVLGQR